MNALAAYVFSDFLAASISSVRLPHSGITLGRWLFHPVPAFIPNRYFAGLVCAVLYIGVCFLPVWLLYRKRIFLKI
jgi:predicted acyltransferase